MNEQVMVMLQKPWVPPVITAVAGAGVSAGVMYIWHRRKLESVVEDTQMALDRIKQEQLETELERIEKDREFNRTIGEATAVNQELTERGNELLRMLRHVKFEQANGEKVTDTNQVQEVPQPVDESVIAPRTEPRRVISSVPASQDDDTDEEHPADQRPLSRLVSTVKETVADTTEKVSNVFHNSDDWDYEAERATRTSLEPYVIHVDEFQNDEMGWDSQSTVTWYEGDEILTDSSDTPIYNPSAVVGELKFGHGSGDPNVVYIRNERMQAEFEVLRDPGSYQENVLGDQIAEQFAEADLRHSKQPLRFRDE